MGVGAASAPPAPSEDGVLSPEAEAVLSGTVVTLE